MSPTNGNLVAEPASVVAGGPAGEQVHSRFDVAPLAADQFVLPGDEALKSILEHLPLAAAMLDTEMRYLAVSRRFRDDYGLGEQALIGKCHYEVFPEILDRPDWMAVHQRALAGAVERKEEDGFVRADGSKAWLRWEVRPWRDAAGGIGGIFLFTEDITGRKRAEQALVDSESLRRRTLNALPAHIAVIDRRGRIVAVNAAWSKFAADNGAEGHPSVSVGGDYLAACRGDLAFGDSAAAARAGIEAVLDGALPQFDMEYRCDSPTEQRWFQMNAASFGTDGERGAVVAHLNISQRKTAEQELRASEERLALALASANAGSWEWDVRTGAAVWSEMHYRLFGYAVGEVEPSYDAWRARVHPEDLSSVEAQLSACIEARRSGYAAEFRVNWPDGSVRWMESRGRFRFDAEGAQRMYGVVIDITERKRNEIELRRARDELEERVLARTEELRQRSDQLARLASELVLTEQRERRRLAQRLHDELQQLLACVKYELDAALPRLAADLRPAVQRASDVLEESISASRLLTAELSPTILHEAGLVAGLQWLARWMSDKHGLTVELRVPQEDFGEREDVGVLIFESIRETLFNVVKHAGVRQASVIVSKSDHDRLLVTVRDDGRGFDADAPRQADDPLSGGFGLFSIRERLTLLGGSLHIDSAPGRGTRITMQAPLAAAAKDEPVAPPQLADEETDHSGNAQLRIRVLLVDDHPVVRQGLSALLKARPDIDVVGEASSGQQAIGLAGALKPAVILMDYSMPGMNGVEATRQIHARWPSIRIIGLSMYDEPTVATAMRAAGAAAYVTKGGDTAALLAAIRGGG